MPQEIKVADIRPSFAAPRGGYWIAREGDTIRLVVRTGAPTRPKILTAAEAAKIGVYPPRTLQ